MNYGPELVGVGRYTQDIVSELVARGRNVTVITTPPHYPYWSTAPWRRAGARNRYSHEFADGAHIWRCPLILRRPMQGVWRLMAPMTFAITSAPLVVWRILRERPELVLCVEPTLLAAPATILAARLTGARLVLHVQDLEPEAAMATGFPGFNPAPLLRRHICRHYDCIITLSPAMRTALIRGGAPGDRIEIWPNWIDVRHIARAHDPEQNALWRSELGLGNGLRIALYAGSINRKHAAPLLIAAARRLRWHAGLAIVIAGDGPLLPALVAAAADLPNVHFLPLQAEEKLGALLHFADVHVMPQDPALDELALPSRLGGMLASGKPIVVTAHPGSMLASFLGDTAGLCAPGDANALATAIAGAIDPGSAPNRARRDRRIRWRKALELDRRRCLTGIVDTLENAAER